MAGAPGQPAGELVATIRWSSTPAAAGEHSQRIGSAMTEAGDSLDRLPGQAAGMIPVSVAPPGSRRFTVTGLPARSAAMIRDSARHRPYQAVGHEPLPVGGVVVEMFTTRPAPAGASGGPPPGRRKEVAAQVRSHHVAEALGGSVQNGGGIVIKRGLTA